MAKQDTMNDDQQQQQQLLPAAVALAVISEARQQRRNKIYLIQFKNYCSWCIAGLMLMKSLPSQKTQDIIRRQQVTGVC